MMGFGSYLLLFRLSPFGVGVGWGHPFAGNLSHAGSLANPSIRNSPSAIRFLHNGISVTPKNSKHDGSSAKPLAQNIPLNGRVAILLSGEVFRGVKKGCLQVWKRSCKEACSEEAMSCTFDAADSFRENVIGSFLRYYATIDLFLGTHACKLLPKLTARYGLAIVQVSTAKHKSYGESVNSIVDAFIEYAGDQLHTYDTVLLTRPDMVFKQPLLSSPLLDFRKFNYASPCEIGTPYGDACVYDTIFTMPGSFVKTFRKVSCFTNNGHRCKAKLQSSLAAAGLGEGYIFWATHRHTFVRGKNDWFGLC